MSTAVAATPLLGASDTGSNVVLTVESLRALLPPPIAVAPGMATGMDALDRALASGGLPRGRLSEVVGATGKLTLLRQVVQATLQRGEWVAYIDASRTLAPRDWADLADAALWIVRPPEPGRAAWCADVLLRSGAFSLVVLDSAPSLSRAVAVRLTGLARESNAAFVTVGAASGAGGPSRLGGAVRLRVSRRRQRLRIAIEKGGNVSGNSNVQRVVEVSCADGVARRLCTHPEVPDRRGAARAGAGKPGKGRRAASPDAYTTGPRAGGAGMLQFC